MIKRLLLASLSLASAAVISSCADQRSHTQAVYMLVDTSGTYAQEVGKAQVIINYLLGTLQSGDSLAVARVKSRSFSEKDIRVVALNVVKLKTDNIDPRRYMGRLEAWQKRVVAAGASEWRIVNDIE